MSNSISAKIEYPMPPAVQDAAAMEVYSHFMQHLRHVPNSREEIKVLSALQFTADMLGYSDAQIAKSMIDLGLRAPRSSMPASYLEFADQCLMRSGWEVGGPNAALLALKEYWNAIGEDKFAAFKRDYSLLSQVVT